MTEEEKTEYEELKAKCVRNDGHPRAKASEKDLARLTELGGLLEDDETPEDPVDGDGLADDDDTEPESDESLKARVAAKRALFGTDRRNDSPLTVTDRAKQRLLRCRLAAKDTTRYPPAQRRQFVAELDDLDRREALQGK